MTASGAKRTRVLRPSCDRPEPPPEKANPPRLALWFERAALAFTRKGTGPIASAPPTFPEDRWSAVVVATVLRPSERTALWPTKVGRMRGGASPSPRTTRIANPCIRFDSGRGLQLFPQNFQSVIGTSRRRFVERLSRWCCAGCRPVPVVSSDSRQIHVTRNATQRGCVCGSRDADHRRLQEMAELSRR